MSKLVAAQVPLPMVAEEVGWSPQRVSALRAELAAEQFQALLAAPAAADQGVPQPGQQDTQG
jgi:hypothetical protein